MSTIILQDYDLLWIQATPAIATMYYKTYLRNTHILFCPDTQLPRTIAKRLLNMTSKKIAIHFSTPCTETKRDTLYKILLKHQPHLSSYCLALPTTRYQTNLLVGSGFPCPYDPEAWIEFIPPTKKKGALTSDLFLKQPWVISKKIFSKKALVVDMTRDMISFDLQQGIQFNRGVENAIRGWMRASPSTLVWIMDEKSLYGENIQAMIQEKRSIMLEKYRKTLFSFLESFATVPIYCYLIDCCTTLPLIDTIAQIQHRHHLCLSKTILLARHKQVDTLNMKPIYLDSIPIHSVSKWESIYLKLLSDMDENAYDDLRYISPELVGLENAAKDYITPMLPQQDTSLTLMETIGTDQSLHTVSAKSPQVFQDWIQIMTEASLTDKDATTTTATTTVSPTPILHHLTTEKIKSHINNPTTYERGLSIPLSDIHYSLDMDHVIISAFATSDNDHPFVLSLRIDGQGEIEDASCGCCTTGRCSHIVAALHHFLQDHPPHISRNNSSSSSSSSSSRKRSLDPQEESDGNDTDNTKKSKSITETTIEHTVETASLNPIVIVDSSSGSSHTSYPLGSIPTITSSHYDSASSRSFSSHSLPPIHSSGSLEASHSSKESVSQEETRGYTADDEEQFSVSREEATQYYNPTAQETQAYRPEEDIETQVYHPTIVLDDSDTGTQKDFSYQTIVLDDSDEEEEPPRHTSEEEPPRHTSEEEPPRHTSDEELPRQHSRLSTMLTQGTSFHTAETSMDNSADSFSNLNHSDVESKNK